MATVTFEPRSGPSWRDPFPMYKAMRDHGPILHVPKGDYWVLSRFEEIWQAARDTETFSSASGLTTTYGDMEAMNLAPTMVMMDPPRHTDFRKLVSAGFTPRKVQALEPAMRSYVVEKIEEMRGKGSCDFVEGLARPLPCWVVANYLGVPIEDRPLFDDWTHAIVGGSAEGNLLDAGGGAAAVGELYEYFTALVEQKRSHPGDDMVSELIASKLEGNPLGILEILGYAFVMITGGNDTATGLLAGAAELLTTYPEQRQKLIDDPGKIANAVEELLRLTSPVQGLARTLTRDVEIDGQKIPAGRKVLLHYGSGNRDEREFGPTASDFDVDRKIDRILTFTIGPHYCLGAAAARMQGQIVLEELLQRCPNFSADVAAGEFARGAVVRRHEALPLTTAP
ncbi:MAG: cytochrome P450 [Candidatus Binatia bacterium]|nr:cytochrome P450 [Candidatus Binatia bacterium]MDG1401447.1 cytochrome P450 [Candidatus Binatia bacterium]MDG1959546.1 cytochrome P450 [Candidatus Binatia bacterium]MDG2010393.1 cytochrome P450 [Candidatus Binatia bacterium]